MTILIDTKNDHLLAEIGEWLIYATAQHGSIYLIGNENIIVISDGTHSHLISETLLGKVDSIRYQNHDGIETVTFHMPLGGGMTFINYDVPASVAQAFLALYGKFTVVTPTQILRRGYPATEFKPHPARCSFGVVSVVDAQRGQYQDAPLEVH